MDCKCLIHPFQNDAGTSQHERLIDELLTRAPQIDARSLAELLNYFVEMSGHINYFDSELKTFDWKPFFQKSIPFNIASIINYRIDNAEETFSFYNTLFEKRPTSTGLQLNANFVYYRFIYTINNWHKTLQDDPNTPMCVFTANVVRNKLQEPLKLFISYVNVGVMHFGMKSIDFSQLLADNVWGITAADMNKVDGTFSNGAWSHEKQMDNLFKSFKAIFPAFVNGIRLISTAAEKNLEQSFTPLKDELQKKHPPHLALIFTFLNTYKELQSELNQFTKKHLDYFYKTMLLFKSGNASPDMAHIVFEVQKQLKSYVLKKGIKVKDGKDDNKQDILFSLDDEILVTKTTIADRRNLFVNNRPYDAATYVEGVYMSPVANLADGVAMDFLTDPKNTPTLGSKYSKWQDPETRLFKPYPNARLGFVLGSPVLFLQEGSTRTIEIKIDCVFDGDICDHLLKLGKSVDSNCCGKTATSTGDQEHFPHMIAPAGLYDAVNAALTETYYYLSQDILRAIIKKGVSSELVERLRNFFLKDNNPNYNSKYNKSKCNCDQKIDIYEKTVSANDYTGAFGAEQDILKEFIMPLKPLTVLFSGEKEWIEPSEISLLSLDPPDLPKPGSKIPRADFKLHIKAVLNPDKDAVTFYDKNKLKEDLGTTQPLVKIELNDKIKLLDIDFEKIYMDPPAGTDCCEQDRTCCLITQKKAGAISLYHFFRYVLVAQMDADKEVITVNVCGLKKFIVQNDDSVMDVNGPIMLFGARPNVNSNFYIGSEEIFLKNWTDVWINLKWDNKPDLTKHYIGYQNQHWDPVSQTWVELFKVIEDNFQVQFSFLEDGTWFSRDGDIKCDIDNLKYNRLFSIDPIDTHACFDDDISKFQETYSNQFHLQHSDFTTGVPVEKPLYKGIKKKENSTRYGFLRLTLKCQDFQHEQYPFVLARQMNAASKLPVIIPGAVYYNIDPSTGYEVLDVPAIFTDIKNSFAISDGTNIKITDIQADALAPNPPNSDFDKINAITPLLGAFSVDFVPPPDPNTVPFATLGDAVTKLHDILKTNKERIDKFENRGAVIPKEPYTPTLSTIALDYKAVAYPTDIDLTHLYPFAGTYKHEEIKLKPSLFPTFCDEGTLFLGLKDLVPGDNLNILFQLAEATADSEENKETVFWSYLDGNAWKPLRNGFEVTDDTTNSLTSSGIIKFSLPANMTTDNTVMPKELHWIKAGIAKNSRAVSETTAIITQAIRATFTNDEANDKLRLASPLASGSLSKLSIADASIKSVAQPFESLNGAVPEAESLFYIRVSETLRHKGRAIQAFDYERIALQAFPKLFKVKCINHSFSLNANHYDNDFPYAPGYVTLAVIPDLNKLKAGNSFQPTVPVSMLEDIDAYVRKRISPFVRFRSVNPRYEKINFCVSVRLLKGKDKNFYREKIKQDIREFLAPWAVGKYDKLTFGQCIYRSDIIQLLEKSDYVDFITNLSMYQDNTDPDNVHAKVCPVSPRSILIAGGIEVCIDDPECEKWAINYKSCDGGVIQDCGNATTTVMSYCDKSGNIK